MTDTYKKEEALKMGRITKERHEDGKARELRSPKSGSVGLTNKKHKTRREKKSWKWFYYRTDCSDGNSDHN